MSGRPIKRTLRRRAAAGGTAAQYAGERSARPRGPRTAVFAAVDGSSTRSRAYESRASAFLRPPE